MNTINVASRTASVSIDVDALSPAIIAKLVAHGVTQKIADAAASALADCGHGKKGDGKAWDDLTPDQQAVVTKTALESMTKVRDALLAGDWGIERTGGAGVDPVVAEIRSILRADYKKGWIAEHNAEAWKALEESEIADGLDTLFAAQDADTQIAITHLANKRIAQRKAERDAAKSVIGLIKMAPAAK